MTESDSLRGGLVALVLMATILCSALSLSGQNSIQLPAEDQPLTLDAQEIFTVGSMDGDEWETFSRITGVAFDGDGNLYLLDADNFRVVKVGPAGELLSEMGRKGGGPGEFGMPFALSVTKGGEVRVFDVGYGGFTLFDNQGAYSRSVPMADGMMFFPTGALLSHSGGGILTAGEGAMSLRQGPEGQMELPTTRPVNMVSLGHEVEITVVYEGWNPATAEGTTSISTSGGGGIQIQAPPMRAFDPELLAGLLPDGRIVVVDSTGYEVKILEGGVQVEAVYARPIHPREVTRRDREAEKERQIEAMAGSGGPRIMMITDDGPSGGIPSEQVRAMMESRIEGMEFGPEIPVLDGMAVDWAGVIWLARSGDQIGEEGPIDLISQDGSYLGTFSPGDVRIPDAFGPGGLAAFIETDEMDVPRVVVRRLSFR